MTKTIKDKMSKTAWLLLGPAIVLYVILTFVFIGYEPERFVTVPNPSWKGDSCITNKECHAFVMSETGQSLGLKHEPKTLQQEVDYMGIGDYMLLVPIKVFFVGCIGLFLFGIIFGVYLFIKNMGHKITDIWKS